MIKQEWWGGHLWVEGRGGAKVVVVGEGGMEGRKRARCKEPQRIHPPHCWGSRPTVSPEGRSRLDR